MTDQCHQHFFYEQWNLPCCWKEIRDQILAFISTHVGNLHLIHILYRWLLILSTNGKQVIFNYWHMICHSGYFATYLYYKCKCAIFLREGIDWFYKINKRQKQLAVKKLRTFWSLIDFYIMLCWLNMGSVFPDKDLIHFLHGAMDTGWHLKRKRHFVSVKAVMREVLAWQVWQLLCNQRNTYTAV